MLVVMAVQAQQLPVAAIRRIIVMVVVFVMDGEFPQSLAFEFAPTSPANRRK